MRQSVILSGFFLLVVLTAFMLLGCYTIANNADELPAISAALNPH